MLIENMNIRYITAKKNGMPTHLLRITRSAFSVNLWLSLPSVRRTWVHSSCK
ncbi:Uncharacterised protein [Vibrio cholerae]|nr:Uncharacterised protein [Vibrio cholerae]CSI84061.1 Uncharacterised protein [Vibrio cholerae]